MGWKELSSKISEAVKEKGVEISEISEYLGISSKDVLKILNGDFSFDDRLHMREYLKRLSWILDLDFEDLWKDYEGDVRVEESVFEESESVSNRFEVFMLAALLVLSVIIAIGMLRVKSKPCVVIKNEGNDSLIVGNLVLKKGESYPTCKSVRVYENKGAVLIRTFGKKNYLVKMENFEVIVNGSGEKSGSR